MKDFLVKQGAIKGKRTLLNPIIIKYLINKALLDQEPDNIFLQTQDKKYKQEVKQLMETIIYDKKEKEWRRK